MWLVHCIVNSTSDRINEVRITYAFYEERKMIDTIHDFAKTCAEKSIQFDYEISESKEKENIKEKDPIFKKSSTLQDAFYGNFNNGE